MAKIDPYLRPLFDALHDMIDPEKVSQHLERGVIEVAPLAFMRGRTLNDSFVILDEAQNTTPEQMKMFLTRLGFGSKMVVTGDVTQVDLPREQQSGLVVVGDILERRRGGQLRAAGADGRRPPPARAADRRGLRGAFRCAPLPRSRRPSRRARGELEIDIVGAIPLATFEIEQLASLALASGGVLDGHVAIEFVGESRITRAQPPPSRDRRADRRALVPDRWRRRDAGRPTRARRRRDLPEHTADLREAIVHGVLHLVGMDHETRRRRDAHAPARARCWSSDARRLRRRSRAGPNVGKSTLTNAIVGTKVAIVSDRPQTTRRAIRGVANGPDWQLVLVDLPGVQRPLDALTERMARRVTRELAGRRRRARSSSTARRASAPAIATSPRSLADSPAPRDGRGQQDGPSLARTPGAGAARRRGARPRARRGLPGLGADRRGRRARWSPTSSVQLPESPFLYERDAALRHGPRRAARRADPRAGAAPHLPGAAARGRRRRRGASARSRHDDLTRIAALVSGSRPSPRRGS